MLLGMFLITITGANYPSGVLAGILFWVQDRLSDVFMLFNPWYRYLRLWCWVSTACWRGSCRNASADGNFFPAPVHIVRGFEFHLPRVAFKLDNTKSCARDRR